MLRGCPNGKIYMGCEEAMAFFRLNLWLQDFAIPRQMEHRFQVPV